MNTYERIKNIAEKKNVSFYKLSKETGISQATFSKWKSERKCPSTEMLLKVASYFNVTVDYLLNGEEETSYSADAPLSYYGADWEDKIKKGSLFPIRGFSRAGVPNLAIEDINYDDVNEWEEITPDMAKTGKFFALHIKGDSMEPELTEKDIVIVRQQSDAETGDIVIAKVNGDEACCKRIVKHKEGIALQSFNPAYSPMYFSNKEIVEKPVTIIGKVIESRRKY